jgi:hypothetical protein
MCAHESWWQGQLELRLGWEGGKDGRRATPLCSATHQTLFLAILGSPGTSKYFYIINDTGIILESKKRYLPGVI